MTREEWELVRRTVRLAVRSGLHCTVGSSNADGSVHLTPIGSLILTEIGRGFYIDIFNQQLGANLARDPRVSILAVDSGKGMWLRSLLSGGFVRPPGVRLAGEAGPSRASTPSEIAQFHRVVGPMLRTRGGRMLWGRLPRVREVRIDSVIPIRTGPMTDASAAGRLHAATLDHATVPGGRVVPEAGT